jgi:protocatechuate 3,4-dioxygenase beta subunit
VIQRLSTVALIMVLLGNAGCARAEEPGAGANASAASAAKESRPREPVVGLPCENCEVVFEGMPAVAALTSTSRIAPKNEPGQRMHIVGRTLDLAGKPVPGVIVYAYHTNDRGVYPTDDRTRGLGSHRHGRLRGWAISDKDGRYEFDTIRPAGYPDTDIPSHIHMHIIEVGRCTYWIGDIRFEDDPRLTARDRRHEGVHRGGDGLIMPVRDAAGVWQVTRDITLGEGINGYPAKTP